MDFDPQNFSNQAIDFKSMLQTYTKHWLWFVLSGLLFLLSAYVLLRYDVPEYSAQAQIKIVDKQSNSQLSVFKDLNILSNGEGDRKVEDEILSFKSRYNLIEVAKRLHLNVRVFALGNIKDSEIYQNLPFKINFIASDSIVQNSNYTFYINLSTNTTFGFSESEEAPVTVYPFGKNISSPIGDIIITPTYADYKSLSGKRYRVEVRPVSTVAQEYSGKIGIAPEQKGSSILNIYLSDPVQKKAQDIIDELLKVYNENSIKDKKAIADKTSDFINDRISNIYSELSSVDQNAADFKSGRGLTDISSQSNLNLSTGAENEQALQKTQVQLSIASSMKDIIDSSDGYDDYIPNAGIEDPSVATTTEKYNELIGERKKLLESSGKNNLVVVQLDQQLAGLKKTLQSSYNSITHNLSLQASSIGQQLSRIKSNLYMAPKNERALRDITRKQETKEALYLYLLQKREESQIAYASAEPDIKIIDSAYSRSRSPIGPNKGIVYLGAFFVGFMIPFFFIYVSNLLDTKVHTRKNLEKLANGIPIIGELPKISKKELKLVSNDDRSILAESLRILRTNLDYMIKSNNQSGIKNLIYLTSSVSGEGKTFISSNLSMILANSNKKVLLIGADIRNPKLYTFFSTSKEVSPMGETKRKEVLGLTEYLFSNSLKSADIINPVLMQNSTVDVIYSGKIPPNPTELLMSDRIKELLLKVSSKYDYVIVDTAPLLSVADTLLITEYASIVLYVVKAGVTESKVLEYPIKLKKDGKLKRLSFVLNNVKDSNLGYGGKYGYGYGKTVKKWWKF